MKICAICEAKKTQKLHCLIFIRFCYKLHYVNYAGIRVFSDLYSPIYKKGPRKPVSRSILRSTHYLKKIYVWKKNNPTSKTAFFKYSKKLVTFPKILKLPSVTASFKYPKKLVKTSKSKSVWKINTKIELLSCACYHKNHWKPDSF